MNHSIVINQLFKTFGTVKAVNGVNLCVNTGEMFGLVGPDGAGKSTTIRILCGLIDADSGSIELLENDISKNKRIVQNKIGYLSQKFSLYGDLSVDENIQFFAEIHGVKDYHARRDELLEFTRLAKFRNRLADQLSGGMKQKLALACSLIHKPEIIFLDEPTTGVDPVSRRDFWKILSNLLKEGITIFMSTPYLDEAERCNHVAMMHKGKIISLDTPENIKSSLKQTIIEVICSEIRQAYKLIKSNTPFEAQLFGDRINVIIDNEESDLKLINELLNKSNIYIIDYRRIVPSLENIFIHLVKNEEDKIE